MQPRPMYTPRPMPPRRSAIPKVIGILMIIFGSFGILGALVGSMLSGVFDGDMRMIERQAPELYSAVKDMQSFETTMRMVGFPLAVIELVGGIMCLKYHPKAPTVAVIYAVISGLVTLINTVVVYSVFKPAVSKAIEIGGSGARVVGEAFSFGMTIGLIFGALLTIAWCLVVGILMSRPAAKAACQAQA
jgi:hypothetical protein